MNFWKKRVTASGVRLGQVTKLPLWMAVPGGFSGVSTAGMEESNVVGLVLGVVGTVGLLWGRWQRYHPQSIGGVAVAMEDGSVVVTDREAMFGEGGSAICVA